MSGTRYLAFLSVLTNSIFFEEPPHPPLCVITNHPARHRDPKTGLPFYNAYAFKEIQKLIAGNFRWSKLTGTWVGNPATEAAKGVPERFTRPETDEERKERMERKERERKERERKEADERKEQEQMLAEEGDTKSAILESTGEASSLATDPSATASLDAIAEPPVPDPAQILAPAPAPATTPGPTPPPAGVPLMMPTPDDPGPVTAGTAAPGLVASMGPVPDPVTGTTDTVTTPASGVEATSHAPAVLNT